MDNEYFVHEDLPNTRGCRNNNPGNIKHNPANQWRGMCFCQTDKDFVQFTSMYFGLRALFKIFLTYHFKHGCKTVSDYIKRFCPNPKEYVPYIEFVEGYIFKRLSLSVPVSELEIQVTPVQDDLWIGIAPSFELFVAAVLIMESKYDVHPDALNPRVRELNFAYQDAYKVYDKS